MEWGKLELTLFLSIPADSVLNLLEHPLIEIEFKYMDDAEEEEEEEMKELEGMNEETRNRLAHRNDDYSMSKTSAEQCMVRNLKSTLSLARWKTKLLLLEVYLILNLSQDFNHLLFFSQHFLAEKEKRERGLAKNIFVRVYAFQKGRKPPFLQL